LLIAIAASKLCRNVTVENVQLRARALKLYREKVGAQRKEMSHTSQNVASFAVNQYSSQQQKKTKNIVMPERKKQKE